MKLAIDPLRGVGIITKDARLTWNDSPLAIAIANAIDSDYVTPEEAQQYGEAIAAAAVPMFTAAVMKAASVTPAEDSSLRTKRAAWAARRETFSEAVGASLNAAMKRMKRDDGRPPKKLKADERAAAQLFISLLSAGHPVKAAGAKVATSYERLFTRTSRPEDKLREWAKLL